MAAVTEMPVSELGRQAREAPRPGRIVATVFAGFFFAVGWLLGGFWRGLAFCAVSARYGYWQGLGLTDEQIAARVAARRQADRPAAPQAA